ncbi:MAG: hypothetical protein QOF76_3158 [Solirubrobacteraceae bacterium]|jgi:deazaflavin-dependent oxidoreductase (nitroreductase family)|nr:hypothetical protein [Solirubrobacteraceae bacterium]
MKRRVVYLLQKYVANPPVRLLFKLGVLPPGYALLETTGRKSGLKRVTPVGEGAMDRQFWIVAEHGSTAFWVRNLQADPAVRVAWRQGLKVGWHTGRATVLPDDDTHARQRALAKGKPLRRANAFMVRVMSTDLLTIRIDLED